ncbi:universal stress protein [uncultured Tateyamaria sp.]|uniref:universal stress protein n=1 Tax=uncultured Tateyamaria sp. TaxID=455651 RepID=UPI002611A4C9|nr:universal stress protein [uncultured Tateyamaria sp.]
MTYSSILTVVTQGDDALRGLDTAMALAAANDAHLEVLVVGIDRTIQGYAYTEMSATLLEVGLKSARTDAEELEAQVAERLKTTDMRASVTQVITPLSMLTSVIRRHARFADLVVLPKPYGAKANYEEPAIVEAALFDAQVPVLILPDGMTGWAAPGRTAVGWNESDESLRAVRSAIPMLMAGDTTYVSVIDPPQHGQDRSDPGGLLAQFLARHGVRCEIDVLARSLPTISGVLIRHCSDRDIDMLVMGAYGRARWSEAMFGGATRDMLENCPVPLFMAH